MRWVDAEVQIKLLKQEVAVKDARIAELEAERGRLRRRILRDAVAKQCECGPTPPPNNSGEGA